MRRHADIQVLFYSAQEIRKIQHGHAVWMDGLHCFLHWLVIKCNLIVIEVKVTHMCLDFYHISWQIIQKPMNTQKVLVLFHATVDEMSRVLQWVALMWFLAIKCSSKSNKINFRGCAGRSCRSSGMQLSCDPGLKQPQVRLTHDMRLWRRAVICPALTVQLKRKNLQNASLRGEPLYSLLNLKRT